MKKNWKNLAIYTAFTITALTLTGCSSSPADNNSAAPTETTTAAPPILVLSIGTKDNMKDYDFTYEKAAPGSSALSWDSSNPDADMMISILAEITGWNLTLANPVMITPGSFTIALAADSSIYTGAVDSSKTEFAITDRKELATAILDSIVANLNAAYEESLTIYFTAADGSDLVIPDTDMTISAAEPYAQPEEDSAEE